MKTMKTISIFVILCSFAMPPLVHAAENNKQLLDHLLKEKQEQLEKAQKKMKSANTIAIVEGVGAAGLAVLALASLRQANKLPGPVSNAGDPFTAAAKTALQLGVGSINYLGGMVVAVGSGAGALGLGTVAVVTHHHAKTNLAEAQKNVDELKAALRQGSAQ